MSFLKEKEKKAFFKLLELDQTTGMLKKHLGPCTKLQTDSNDGPLLLVSSSRTFPDQGSVIRGSRVVAEQCFGKDRIDIDVSKLTTNQGFTFLVCEQINEEYLTLGDQFLSLPVPAILSAYIAHDQEILELIFQKTESGSYKFDVDASVKANERVRNLELGKAAGAPIIIEGNPPKRSAQVVGVLDIKSDGTLYPVLFDGNFNLDSKSNRTPTEKSSPLFAEIKTGEAAVGEKETHQKNNKTDLRHKMNKLQLSDGQQMCQEKQPSSASKMVSGLPKQSGASVFESESMCIKRSTLADAPNTNQLLFKLKMRLDPKMPMGNDYRALADSFGFTHAEIEYLHASKGSPTAELLHQKNATSLEELKNKLTKIDRHDAAQDIKNYFKEQGCNCSKCAGIR